MVVSHGRLKSPCLACHVAFAILDDDKCVGNAITVRMLSVDHNFLQHLSKKLTSTCHNATSAYKLCDDRETHDVQETARNSQFHREFRCRPTFKGNLPRQHKDTVAARRFWPTSSAHRSFLRAHRDNNASVSRFLKQRLASRRATHRADDVSNNLAKHLLPIMSLQDNIS